MPKLLLTTIEPIQRALEGWATTVEAVQQEISRIVGGGHQNPPVMAKLMAEVEGARQRFERERFINAIQSLSLDEGTRQPAAAAWLAEQDEKATGRQSEDRTRRGT